MLHILFIAGAPVIVPSLKGVFGPNDLAFEKSRQCCVLRS